MAYVVPMRLACGRLRHSFLNKALLFKSVLFNSVGLRVSMSGHDLSNTNSISLSQLTHYIKISTVHTLQLINYCRQRPKIYLVYINIVSFRESTHSLTLGFAGLRGSIGTMTRAPYKLRLSLHIDNTRPVIYYYMPCTVYYSSP